MFATNRLNTLPLGRDKFTYNAQLSARIRLPNANVGIITAAEHIVRITAVLDAKDLLHALTVIDLATAALIDGEYAQCLVVRTSDELLACR